MKNQEGYFIMLTFLGIVLKKRTTVKIRKKVDQSLVLEGLGRNGVAFASKTDAELPHIYL